MNDVKNLEAFKIRKNVHFLPNLDVNFLTGDTTNSNMGKSMANYFLRKITFAITNSDSWSDRIRDKSGSGAT